jgi:large subunit ribosomal protein L27
MSKTKSTGTKTFGRDSISKRLGVKLYAGQVCKSGNVIIRQRGTKFLAGKNVRKGKDGTLYAVKEGKVKFRTIRKSRFNGKKRIAKVVDVIEAD